MPLPPQPGHDGGSRPQTPGDPHQPRTAPPGAPADPGPTSGAIPFESLAEIAAGATARVDLCRLLPPHPRAGGLVAVKRLHPHIAEDPTFAKQFFDEVWMTASLRHPNVVEVRGWGTDEQGSYLAVELVQGVSLLRLMKTIFDTGEAFTERMVVYIASRVCRGLAAAHSLRAQSGEMLHLVHRDLTPGNVLVSFSGEVKIADFGMAKAKQRLTKTLTGMRKGEPTYMAPEQARSDDIDARADLFSLGVMLFELFAGRRPWIAKSDFDMVQITTREPPADLRALRPKIDKELVNVVYRCLEKEPGARFQSANEITARLDEWLTVHGYQEDNEEALGRFVRRNAMRQMRWFESAIAGDLSPQKVGREAPRVPTYTEHTQQPGRPLPRSESTIEERGSGSSASRPQPREAPKTPPPPSAPNRPLIPPRPSGAPADPRSIRAANAVQQLKKLAPPVEPPRGRARPRPSMEEVDDDATDVELRLGGTPSQPRIIDAEDGDDASEEIPTLVQKGDAKLQELRAEARKLRAARSEGRGEGRAEPRVQARATPAYVPSGLFADEDSDGGVTTVKQEEVPRRNSTAHLPSLVGIADPESELPTEPRPLSRARPPPEDPPSDAPTPIARQRAKTVPTMRQVIPPSPGVPPQPFPTGAQVRTKPLSELRAEQASPAYPKPGMPPPPVAPEAARDGGYAPKPAGADKPSRATARPPPPPPEPIAPMVSSAPDPSRTSNHDDVQVIDRSALQQKLSSEEAVVAEADRLAIEAVRRSEEARAAQLRAERKAVAARHASEAAMIATDAVRMIRSAGLPAAIKRLEEARVLEQNLQSGKIPVGEATGSLRPPPSSYPGPRSNAPPGMPAAPQAEAPAGGGAHEAERGPGHVHLSSATPSGTAPFPVMAQGAVQSVPPSLPPPAGVGTGAVKALRPSYAGAAYDGPETAPPAASQAASPLVDPEAFRARLKPSILGLPSAAVAGLAVVGLGVVLVLILLLAK